MDGPSRRPAEPGRSAGMPSLGEAPSGGAKTFWLLLGRLPKVTRCKSGTISGRYRSNGYVHPTPPITAPPAPKVPNSQAHDYAHQKTATPHPPPQTTPQNAASAAE